MQPLRLVIPKPCDADWTTMTGSESKRFCDLCTKNVHDISTLTEVEARTLLRKPEVCVRYTPKADGSVRFQPSVAERVANDPTFNLVGSSGVRALVAASAFATSLLAACAWPVYADEPPADGPNAVESCDTQVAYNAKPPAPHVQPELVEIPEFLPLAGAPMMIEEQGEPYYDPSELELQEQRAIEQLRLNP